MKKTNAMRILDQKKIVYQTREYQSDGINIDGISVAEQIQESVERVFKTIVLHNGNSYYVTLIPVADHIDLKACAKGLGVKKLELLHVKELFDLTGYVRGGCSPIGMKKQFPTIIDETCLLFDTIIFSGGRIGTQIEMKPETLIELIGAKTGAITAVEN
ncbi:Cys-tRNA(Pro) deacylase [Erysipelothrix rhusiopathiae]|nr:Cys-tRNA(Pro) deacylase [Erysipelothrix rhusiopathiae]